MLAVIVDAGAEGNSVAGDGSRMDLENEIKEGEEAKRQDYGRREKKKIAATVLWGNECIEEVLRLAGPWVCGVFGKAPLETRTLRRRGGLSSARGHWSCVAGVVTPSAEFCRPGPGFVPEAAALQAVPQVVPLG